MEQQESVGGVVQHWKENWQPYEGTRAWATEVGFKAISQESEDLIDGPPPRKDLRKGYFERDVRMAGTGPLVSWADGRQFAGHNLEEIDHGIHLLFLAYLDQSKAVEEIEKGLCDLFMGLRIGSPDRLHDFLRMVLEQSPPWLMAVRRALQFEVMQPCFPGQPQNGESFWQRGLIAELVEALGPIDTSKLKWNGFIQDTPLRFGQLLLWSPGACGQIIRSQILNDWTHLVLEQGLDSTLSRVDLIHQNGLSYGRWLVDAFIWRARLTGQQKSKTWSTRLCWINARRNAVEQRTPELGDVAWRLKARHWRWITEWVIAWRAEISSPLMEGRAMTLAHFLLEADGCSHNPFGNPIRQGTIPDNPSDLQNRITTEFKTKYTDDWRLTDEIYPAIFVVVAGWLRGSGRASSSNHVLAAAPWLSELIPTRRRRMVAAVHGVVEVYTQLKGLGRQGETVIHWRSGAARFLQINDNDLDVWLACQATPHEELLGGLAHALIDNEPVPLEITINMSVRFRELVGTTGAGTGLGRGVDLDLLWGLEALAICLKSLPITIAERAMDTNLL